MEPTVQLPPLRQDLQIQQQRHNELGEPQWLIHDPMRNRYFQISLTTVQLLNLWKSGMPLPELQQQAAAEQIEIQESELLQIIDFFSKNHLLEVADSDQLTKSQQQNRRHWFHWLIHNYLFIRIPLWHPDPFLQRTIGRIELLFQPRLHRLIQLLGMVGLLLVIQQWEQFSHTFDHFFSWQGLGFYALTLIAIKSLHELAHAYSAKRLQCQVPSIGVAFLVLFPVLYTDTTDAWKLTDHRQRLRIVLAGVKMELHLALLATFFWTLLPDGPIRTVAFFVATTSWLTSVMVNLNPFMRFDGYFALSDWLQAPNLQPRAFALGRWKLREWLFGFDAEKPEKLSSGRERLFILYAWITWIYRLLLFLGIALLVYHFTFKLLGILLFAVEIVWFILLPIYRELEIWWKIRDEMRWNRNSATALLLLSLLIALLLIPWQQTLYLPAVLQNGALQPLYAPESGEIRKLAVETGDMVEQGEPLLVIDSAFLRAELRRKEIEFAYIEQALQRQITQTHERLPLQQQKAQLQMERTALLERINRLTLVAPLSGVITFHNELHAGQTVAHRQPLLSIRPSHGAKATGYIEQKKLAQLEDGKALWISDQQPSKPITLSLQRVALSSSRQLPHYELSSSYGGPIPSYLTQNQSVTPESSIYAVHFLVDSAIPAPVWRERGVIQIQGQSNSLLKQAWQSISALLIEESSF